MSSASSRQRPAVKADLARNRLFLLFLGVALLCGGAGSSYPLIQLALELLGLAIMVRVLLSGGWSGSDPAFRAGLAIFLASGALLILQIIPLPALVWQALPGRETATAVQAAMGWPSRWHALSLTPDATFRMLLTLIPPLAAFLIAATASQRARVLAVQVIVAFALVSTVLAALQVAAGESAPTLYATSHRGFGVGFFVNRNHQAVFLLIAMVLAAVPGVIPTGSAKGGRVAVERRLGAVGVVALLALGVLATTSRTALVLVPLVFLVAVGLIFEMRQARRWIVGATLAYVVAGAVLYPTSLVQRPLARFATAAEDLRYQYWSNTWYAIGDAFPWGTGFGSFRQVYRSVEPLDQVTPLNVNNAHPDFIEVALEGGLPGIVLMLAVLVVTVGILVVAWRRADNRTDRVIAAAGLAAISITLVFSIVDYPLRMTVISVICAFLLGCGIATRSQRGHRADRAPLSRLLRFGVRGGALLLAIASLSNGLSATFVQSAQPGTAVALAPWSSSAWLLAANQAQIDERLRESGEAAQRALSITPIDAGAVRAAAYAELAQGNQAKGALLFQNAAALGWRDRLTQLWLIEAGLATGNLQLATERLDGLLRQGTLGEALQSQLRAIFLAPGGEAAIAERLASRPPWRQGFLNAIAQDGPQAPSKLLSLLKAMRAANVAATPQETALIRWHLGDAGQFAAVRAVWVASGGSGLVGDGGFEALTGVVPAGAAPFAWRAPTLAGVRVLAAEGGANGSRQSISLSSDGYAAGTALSQTIVLSPGRYRLDIAFRRADGRTAAPVAMQVACVGATQPPLLALRPPSLDAQWKPMAGRFTVPSGCGAQALSFTLQQTTGEGFSIGIDQISIVNTAN